MCMSPHEMSNSKIQEDIDYLTDVFGRDDPFWSGRIEALEEILKERAENGTWLDYTEDQVDNRVRRSG